MVHYEGHVTKDGELLINISGSLVSLHEFLEAVQVGKQRASQRAAGERRRARGRSLAVAK
jgi:hypothetical protein